MDAFVDHCLLLAVQNLKDEERDPVGVALDEDDPFDQPGPKFIPAVILVYKSAVRVLVVHEGVVSHRIDDLEYVDHPLDAPGVRVHGVH